MRSNAYDDQNLPDHTSILIDQSRALGRIEAGLMHSHDLHRQTAKRLDHGERRFDKQDRILFDIHRRVTQVEARPKLWRKLFDGCREIASLKEWATGALLVALALKGLVSPAEVKALLLGAGPK